MIEREAFVGGWARLEERFGEHDGSDAYYEYLTDRLTTAQFTAACRTVWATREFFPRPVDFVIAAHADLLSRIRQTAIAWSKDDGTWLTKAGGKDSLAMDVVRSIGGVDQVLKLLDRGPGTFRREVEAHLDTVLALDGHDLPGDYRGPALPPGVSVGKRDRVEVEVVET